MKKKAFTLIELIVSLAIVSVLVLLINAMMTLNFKSSSKVYQDDFSYKEAMNAVLLIENIVRQAEEIRPNHDIHENYCNFTTKFKNSEGKFVDYVFYVEDQNLKARVNKGKGTDLFFGYVDDIKLKFDGKSGVDILVIGLDGESYKSYIDIGDRIKMDGEEG